MTSIATWFNKEVNPTTVWIAGDSLITRISGMNNSVLLDSGAKIFSIPVICKKPSSRGFFEELFFETKIGLAYSGSSLVGLNVQAALTTIFSNLNSYGKPPSMNAIAEYSTMIVENYIKTLSVIAQNGALCELAIIGFCYLEKKLKIYHLKHYFDETGVKVSSESFDSDTVDDNFVLLLGDKKEEILNQIISFKENCSETVGHRAPKNVLEDIIKKGTYQTIGGHLQLGICSTTGFNLFSTSQPIPGEEPKAFLSYLGFDVSGDAGTVGDCFVGINGMV